ncbi:dihydrolipoyl dehydrogenase family protein (plasmid) [Enterococcus sp. 22-H-5-01]|uniref:dihydrolipoyl dehydrogenase family protein n=1 Tax=Enterococcus sp. 22-H-5-01 TaxID=3418555 RepID=UPI003D079BE9
MKNFDVLFIGSGQAAWNAALPLAMAGKKVGVIEENKVAGVCTNFGCDAKAVLDGPVKALEIMKQYEEVSLNPLDASINWEKLMQHKHTIIDPLADQVQGLLERVGVTFIFGHAEFTDPTTIEVKNEKYTAEKFVIATGQRPARLNIEGKELLKSSTDFFDLEKLPKEMVFVGAGYVSMELASIAVSSGANVQIIEFGSRALSGFDSEFADKLVKKMSNEGVSFHFNQAVTKVEKNGADQLIVTTDGGKQITADYVIDATGRIPNVEHVGLDKAGVTYDRQGIIVDGYLQTTQKNIYASGDVVKKEVPKLTPTAAFEARYLTRLFTGQTQAEIDYPLIATAAFTLPRIAQVGVTTSEATENPEKYTIKTIDLANTWDYKAMNEKESAMKLIFDQSKNLVGAANYSNEAPEVINSLTTIIQNKLSLMDLDKMLYAFPTLDYNLPFYLMQAMG